MKNILSLMTFSIVILFTTGCGGDKAEKPTVTMPDTSGPQKLVGESGGKTTITHEKLEAPPPGK